MGTGTTVSPDTDLLRTLLDCLGEGVYVADAQGRTIAANRRLAEILELPPSLVMSGEPWDRLVGVLQARGTPAGELRRHVEELLRPAPAAGFRLEHRDRNGRRIEIRGRPMPGGGFALMLADLLQPHEAAEALRLSEARFRDFAAAASDFQWEADEEPRIVSVSEEYAKMPPREIGEIIGRRLWEVPGVDTSDEGRWRDLREALAERRPVSDFRYSIVDSQGRRLYRRLSGRPAFDSLGRFTGYRFATRDETAEVEARNRARRAEELLSRAVESIPEGFAIYDSQERLVLMNRRYLSYRDTDVEAVQPGSRFEEVIREGVRRGVYADAAGREEEFVQQRLAAFREGKGRPVLVRSRSGRYSQTRDYHLGDGGTVVVRTDVTELIERENALRARQLQLDLALRTAKAAYWEYDPADRTHQLVPNYYAMLGYSEAGAPRGRSEWLQLVHPDDIAVIEAAQALGPHDDADHRYEFRIRAADGSWRWLLSSFRAVDFDPQGRPLRLLGIDTDITESKEAELALQRERDRAQTYLDVAGVIMTVLDAEHRITLLNRKGCEILGVTEEEVLGLDWFDTFGPPEERERQRAIYSEFLAGRAGPAQDIEMTMMTRRGEVRLVTWHDILLRDDSGKVIGGLSSGEDITEQRAAERKRDEFRTLIESTAQASPDGILVTDDTGRYLFWNKRLQEMWRLDEAHLEARRSASGELDERVRPFTDLVADPQCYLKEMRRIYAEHGDPAREFAELRLKDGRVLEQFSARVSAGDPPITAVAWIYRDITQAKRRDDELAHSQRLAAVGELSGGMAHELNNLLMVISGGLELIQERAAADPGTAELTGMASTAVRRGADLIRQVLAFARQQPLAPRLTDLNALIAEALTPLPQLLGERIRLEFRRGEPLWRSVIDPGQLQTALVNLALNARDAMADGGRLTIETANRSLDEDFVAPFADLRAGDYVMIAVSDEGCGMAPEIAQRAFEPFFTTKPVGQGTGLGLSMVFGFVKQSGGHVQIESDVGRGTTVRIFLPRSLQEAAAEEAPTASPAKTNGETVLVVEDEAGVSAVACAFFHSLGYKVLEAPDGPRALRILKRGEPIHLLFTDLVLPEAMNGKEVAEAARRLHPAIKVLFASGYPMDTLMTEGHIDAGATLLQKPYRRKDLVEALQRLGK